MKMLNNPGKKRPSMKLRKNRNKIWKTEMGLV